MKLPFRTAITLALFAGMLLIVLSIAASYITINTLISGAQHESRTGESVLLLERVVSDFKATESLQRRYLLTYSPQDLDAYRQALALSQQTLLRLHAAHANEGADSAWRILEDAIAGRFQSMEQAIAARQQQGLEAAAAIVGNDTNRKLHEDIEAVAARIKNSESQALESSKDETRKTAQTVKQLILLGGLLCLSVFAWAIQKIMRTQEKRRRIEAKLSDSEAMSRAVTESMAEGLVTATAEGRIVNANSAARHLFGYRLDDMVGKEVTMLLPARYRMGFSAFFATLPSRQHGFREWDVKVLGLRHDATEFPVNVSFGDVNVGGQRLFTAIIHDITESNRISEALRDSEAQLRQLTDSVPALIAYVDREQRFQFHNRAYEEAFGLRREQIQNKPMHEVLGPVLYAQVKGYVEEALAGYSVRYEREQVTASGDRREYVMNYFPRYGEGDEHGMVIGFSSLGTDVTELKRIDRMKSEFVSTVSHELRTPLTSIRGSLGLVWGGVAGELPERAKSLVGIAKTNCERLIRLINDILDSEKIESGKMTFELQAQELEPLMQQALADNEGFAEQHQVTVVLHRAAGPVRVCVDSDRLTQVVTNLLSNAIKYSPPQGTVKVMIRRLVNRVRVEVIDSGPGIPEEFRKRLFQKFSQADSSDTRQKGGTGLGLSISKAIIERMDGSIGFTSESNKGTTFFFELPEWREAPPVTAPMGLVARPRVLVCEDDPDVAKLIGMMLDKGGYDADMAHTAEQARDYLKMESYAAMTVDIRLPYENGLSLIRELRANQRTAWLPVLVLSVTAAEARQHASNQALAISDWLDKPLDERRLLASLKEAIKSRTLGRRGEAA
ncbi:multi-sensor hybrid histidine kinase [Polaromonas sp. YR568]|uniref:PAS domain S-box protein n=1 Tax=Polaromonas sp. YR568 TaxID=1855301 RepID=UPI0008E88589|nr:PAS domain S-box protein [Polaromonas sp. YR568]SFV00418.1 multi-sensor hybrid histidine kinase [Polaromonas sp. YR568]